MKLQHVMIALLVLNVGLLGYLLKVRLKPAAPIIVPSQEAPKPAAGMPKARVRERVTTVTNEFRWQQLEAEDYRDYITRLRSVGCPETTIRDIIIADLDKLFSPRLRALYPYRADLKYWQSEEEELANNVNQDATLREERAIEREKREVLKELMGVDLLGERLKLKGHEDYFQRRLGFLPEEKRSAVRDVLEKYHELDWRIREKQLSDGIALSDEDRAELRQLKASKDAELGGLITGAEREQLDLWLSETASSVRHDVYGMNISEQEFMTLYRLRQDFDQQWPRDEMDLNDPYLRQRWEEAKSQLDARIQAQIGTQRFAEYKRGQDPDFHELSATVARFQLPAQKAVEVYEYKRAYLDYRDAVGFDPNLNPEQKDSVLRSIQQETLLELRKTLGERAFNHYVRRARWLKS